MNYFRCIVYSICLLPAVATGFAQQAGKPVLTPVAPPPPEATPSAMAKSEAGAVSANYIIGADDSLKIVVFEKPNLSDTLLVRPDGKITMPLINEVTAAGFTPTQLQAEITERLKKYVTDPVVNVTVVGTGSKRIFLTGGGIGHEGPLGLSPGMTVIQAIASAGGISPYANKKKIYILRGDQKIPFNYKKGLNGDMQGISLLPGDTIVVPE